jgi:hypothetical protein
VNRKARRAKLKVGDMVCVNLGRCRMTEGNDEVLQCYACDGPAACWPWPEAPKGEVPAGHGVAIIDFRGERALVPVCQACLETGDTSIFVRKLFGLNLEISEGGEKTMEEIREIADALAEREETTTQ